jgi:uncharacterized protein (TIGR02996 family)
MPRPNSGSNPTIQRFERTRGSLRHVARVERRGLEVVLTRGRFGDDGKVTKVALATPRAARDHADALVEKLLAEGFAPAAGPPGSTAVRGRVACNPELERLLEEAPDDPTQSLVYADWLTEQGDVRGELIRIQVALEERPGDLALLRTEGGLLRDFEAELLGPLAKRTVLRLSPREVLPAVRWRRGFPRAVRLWNDPKRQSMDQLLSALFNHPAGRFVERLILAGSVTLHRELEVLRGSAPRTLSALEVGEGSPPHDVGGFFEVGLRQLVVLNQPFSLGDATHTNLEELLFDIGHTPPSEVLVAMRRMAFPQLRHLAVPSGFLPCLPEVLAHAPKLRRITLQEFGADDLSRFFALGIDGRLDELGLDECSYETAVQLAARLAKPPILIAYADPEVEEIPASLRARLQPPRSFDALDRPLIAL